MKEHWFKKICKCNPENCGWRMENKCEYPPADCLLYEKRMEDYREEQQARKDEMEAQNGID